MKIGSNTETLEHIFSGMDTKYAVPHYQRDYSWGPDQRMQLWSDIHSSFKKGNDYFLGSVVLNTENLDDTGCHEIVDGQQRLTTLTTLFAVVRDICDEYLSNPSNEAFNIIDHSDGNREKATRARNKASQLIVHYSEPDNYFLQLNEKDQPKFKSEIQKSSQALLRKPEQSAHKSESRLIKSKKFFSKKICEHFLQQNNGFINLDQFISFCMTRLKLLKITVGSDTDAYLLFETLNDRGLDLSISDLVKNRLLMSCDGDEPKKQSILAKWNELIEKLQNSRYQPHDFLRFYWCAFHKSCTKKELYKEVRNYLDGEEVETVVDSWNESADFFCEITAKNFRYPNGSLVEGKLNCFYAELNTLGYSVYLPLFLHLNAKRPEFLENIAPICLSYLFRVITIGNFSAGRAEDRFNKAIETAKNSSSTLEDIKIHFLTDPESADSSFEERIRKLKFEENKTARYFLSKIHSHEIGSGHSLNETIHLEHVLPQSKSSWAGFDCGDRTREDWVYNIGNMTLLEEGINKSLQAKPFTQKVERFKQRTAANESDRTAIPMSYRIYQSYESDGRDWNSTWIMERASYFAEQAKEVWKLDVVLSEEEASSALDNDDIDNSEQI